MLSWVIVPLQYLYSCWRAERLVRIAAAGGSGHSRAMNKAEHAIAMVEAMQIRFANVTDWVDVKRRRDAMRERISA